MIHNYITYRKQPASTGGPLVKALAVFCYLKDACVMSRARTTGQKLLIVMLLASQNLLAIAILPVSIPVVTDLSTNKHMGHSSTFKNQQ